jgi:hypothetical protein
MAKNSTKNYISGSAKKVTFADGGEIINLDLKLSDLAALPANERGYIKITISERKTVDEYGNTHSIYENAYVPKAKGTAASAPATGPSFKGPKSGGSNNSFKSDKMPF